MSINHFKEYAFSEELQRGIDDVGFTEATDIQAETIPLILEGHDVIGQSQTGSGKTAAFGLPAINLIDKKLNRKITQVLVLSPTRELALQSCEEINKFAKHEKDIKSIAIYGGEAIDRQFTRMRQSCQIVVGTPGRIMDHMNRKTLDLSQVKMVVLDEADEMLNMGFIDDIKTILTNTPAERQTILFSATMPPAILAITKQFQKDPKIIKVKNTQLTVDTTEQYYFDVPRGRKLDVLYSLLELYQPNASIIFCNTKKMVDELVTELGAFGYSAQALHGDMKQGQRTQVMNSFKDGKFKTLIATDVAARGIDVNNIEIVFNFDLPQEDEYYVHRIGRTGRAGKTGLSITLIQGNKQLSQLKNIMKYTKCKIDKKEIPTPEDINELRIKQLSEKITEYMTKHKNDQYFKAIEKMTGTEYSIMDIAAGMFAMSLDQNPKIKSFKVPTHDSDSEQRYSSRSRKGYQSSDRSSGRYADRSSNRSSERGYDRSSSRSSERSKPKKVYDDKDMVTISISLGKDDHLTPNQVVGAIAGESGVPGRFLGAIKINKNKTTIDVPKEHESKIVECLQTIRINGKKFDVNQ